MQSKTSFFNQSIFWKTVSRFWPVWGSYLAAGILALPIVILANLFDQMGITPNDSSFFKLTRRYIGKDPRKVVKHFQDAKLVRF